MCRPPFSRTLLPEKFDFESGVCERRLADKLLRRGHSPDLRLGASKNSRRLVLLRTRLAVQVAKVVLRLGKTLSSCEAKQSKSLIVVPLYAQTIAPHDAEVVLRPGVAKIGQRIPQSAGKS